MFTQPDTFYSDRDLFISTWRNVLVSETAGDLTLERAKVLGRGYLDIARRYPNGFVACAFIRPGVPVASTEARNEVARMLREHGATLKRIVTVIEESGLRGQMLRTVIRGINAMSRANHMLTCANATSAYDLLVPLVDGYSEEPEITMQLLTATVQRMRANYRLAVPLRPRRASLGG